MSLSDEDIFKIKREEIINKIVITIGKHTFVRKVFVTTAQHNDKDKIIAFEILERISKGDIKKNNLQEGDIEYRFTYFTNTKRLKESPSIPLLPDKDIENIFKELKGDNFFIELSKDAKYKSKISFLAALLRQTTSPT